MKKYPSKSRGNIAVTGIKGLLLGELALMGVAYYYWRRLYYNQDYRYQWYQKRPKLLDGYYRVMRSAGGLKQKQEDYAAWGLQPVKDS